MQISGPNKSRWPKTGKAGPKCRPCLLVFRRHERSEEGFLKSFQTRLLANFALVGANDCEVVVAVAGVRTVGVLGTERTSLELALALLA